MKRSLLWHVLPLILAVPSAGAAPPETTGEAAYWYRNGHREALLPVVSSSGNVRALQQGRRFRNAAGGPLRELGDSLFVCIPASWNEGRVADLARAYELEPQPGGSAEVRRFRALGRMDALDAANAIFENEGVTCAAPLWRKPMRTRSLNDPLLDSQWHLNNSGQGGGLPGADVGAFAAWTVSRGAGVTVGVVDDGLELRHPDLAANLLAGASRDYIRGGNDTTAGKHGTAVGGVVAAAGGNGLGGRGVAPAARLVGLRILDEEGMVDEGAVADVIGYDWDAIPILNNSWGPADDAYSAFEGPSELARAAMQEAVSRGRSGLGRVMVWAAGNGGGSDNSNLDGYANARQVIAVTATGNHGRAADYAEEGANILLNAPSSGGSLDILSTDRSGALGYNDGQSPGEAANADYTNGFGGTSAAAPMVSGVAALVLAANPALNWREVRQVLAASATQNDAAHSRWRHNAAGYAINEQYGYGRVNAAGAVSLATRWNAPIDGEHPASQYRKNVDRAIPDNDLQGISDEITVSEQMRVEFVEVTADIEHSYWGDISLYLTSPAGTEIRLMTSRYLPQGARTLGFHDWKMGDALHLGELSAGRWKLRVVDDENQDSGVLRSWGLKVHGTAVPVHAEQLPLFCAGHRLDTGEGVGGATFYLGVNRHGGRYEKGMAGTTAEDLGLVFGVIAKELAESYLAVAEYRDGEGTVRYLRYDSLGWHPWDGNLADVASFADEILSQGAVKILHHGRLPAGRYRIWGAYRQAGGRLVYCPQPVEITVSGL